jgi:hypothetical protein
LRETHFCIATTSTMMKCAEFAQCRIAVCTTGDTMTRAELNKELKREFTYVPEFDVAHVQLDETISREIKTGQVYHALTDYGKLEFANMHIELHLTKTLHPLSNRLIVGINDEMIPKFGAEMPAADFLAYSVTESFLGNKIVEYWFITALFAVAPLIANEIFNRSKWLAYRMEPLTVADRKEMLI